MASVIRYNPADPGYPGGYSYLLFLDAHLGYSGESLQQTRQQATMTGKAIPWFVIAGLLIALVLSVRSCRGRLSQDQVVSAIQKAGDSVRRIDSPLLVRETNSRIRLTGDSISMHQENDSLKNAIRLSNISLKQDKSRLMNSAAELGAELRASVDSGTYRRLEAKYDQMREDIDAGIADVETKDSQTEAKDSLQTSFINYLQNLINEKNGRIDTLGTNNQTLLNLLGQATKAAEPHGEVYGGFNVGGSAPFTAAGISVQYKGKNNNIYGVNADYTSLKSGLFMFTWLTKISFKKH
jgi:hypothetical protein